MQREADADGQIRSRASWILALLWNLAFLLLGAELVAVAAYWQQTGELYYFRGPSGRSTLVTVSTIQAYRIHPYFGFQLRPHSGDTPRGVPANNNHGFRSDWDFPRPRLEHEFLIGVFGGSAASYLAQFEFEEGVIAQQISTVTGLDAADVVTLNFAQGGFKQPQQVQVLSYFLAVGQELDAVVNIDGFNEVALGALNQASGFEASQPSIEHVLGLQSVTPIGLPGQRELLSSAREAYDRYVESYNRAWSEEGRLALEFLYHFFRYKAYHGKFEHDRNRAFATTVEGKNDPSWLYLQPRSGESDGHETGTDWDSVLDVWAHGAVTLAGLAEAEGIPYVHVLQPNQYHQTARIFSADERAVAINQRSPYRPLIEVGYPLLEARARRLEEVDVHALFDLFDQMAEPAYSDDCCHYTEGGNRLLAEKIGELLAERLRQPPG